MDDKTTLVAQKEAIRQYILDHVPEHQQDIVAVTCDYFDVEPSSVQSVLEHLLQKAHLQHDPKSDHYQLGPVQEKTWHFTILQAQKTKQLWQQHIAPHLGQLSAQVQQTLKFVIEQLIGNSVRHANAQHIYLHLHTTHDEILVSVRDDGQGLLTSLQSLCKLGSTNLYWFHLLSGHCYTTHTGTSLAACAQCSSAIAIDSGQDFLTHPIDSPLLAIVDPKRGEKHSIVRLLFTPKNLASFEQLSQALQKGRRYLALHLLQKGKRPLAKQQAVDALQYCTEATEVILDFAGVHNIALTFADKVFHEFALANPHIKLDCWHANAQVQQQIQTILEKMQAATS